jgi:hypothetical protein
VEPALVLSGFLGEPFFGFVKADGVEDKAAGRAMAVAEPGFRDWVCKIFFPTTSIKGIEFSNI